MDELPSTVSTRLTPYGDTFCALEAFPDSYLLSFSWVFPQCLSLRGEGSVEVLATRTLSVSRTLSGSSVVTLTASFFLPCNLQAFEGMPLYHGGI